MKRKESGAGRKPRRAIKRTTKTISISLAPELAERVRAASAADARTVSNWLRLAIDQYLAEREAARPRLRAAEDPPGGGSYGGAAMGK
jgi:hypothetical protein